MHGKMHVQMKWTRPELASDPEDHTVYDSGTRIASGVGSDLGRRLGCPARHGTRAAKFAWVVEVSLNGGVS
jgi:hypothetical protein